MARPGLHKHPKFKRLMKLLGEPAPHVRGYLEMIWEVAYECGNPVIGSSEDVELAADYPGTEGRLCKALSECGIDRPDGTRGAGFIEPVGESKVFQIHDLFHHAPDYVSGRNQREQERQKDKSCEECGNPFNSPDNRAKYCSAACKQSSYRRRATDASVTDRNALRNVTQRYRSPAPAPAPAPALNSNTPASAGGGADAPHATTSGNGKHAEPTKPGNAPADEIIPVSKPKTRAKPSGNHQLLIDYFCEIWRTRYGGADGKYPFNGGKDGEHVKWILNQAGGDLGRAKRSIDAYFRCREPFFEADKHGLGNLKSQFRRFLQTGPPASAQSGIGEKQLIKF